MEAFNTICVCCKTIMIPDDQYIYPLCPKCKERIFGKPCAPTEKNLRDEILKLRDLMKNSIFFSGWLLHDLRLLQNLVCDNETVLTEADDLYYYLGMGRGCLPDILSELASYYSSVGAIDLAEDAVYEAIAMLNAAFLLLRRPPRKIAYSRVACYEKLSKIYDEKGDNTRARASKQHARVCLRNEISDCLQLLNKLGDGE